MLVIIFSWIFLFIVIFLIGKLALNSKVLSFLKLENNLEWYEYLWIGLAVILAILQVWSIFLPVNIYSLVFILTLSLLSAILLFRKNIKIPKINIYYFSIIGILFFITSYFSSLSCGWPDTQGYHFNAVKWANLYPVVPGLANLHTRLGFNSSFFIFASMIDSVMKDRSSHVALSFMVSALLAEYVWIFLKSKDKYLKFFLSFTLPVLIANIIRTGQVSSLSYDFALLLVVLAICIELIQNNKKSFFVAGVLSIILLTIKLSGAVFSLVVLCFVLYQLVFKNKNNLHTLWLLMIIGIIFILPYIIRNVILTGWPFYPIPILRFNLIWTVPYETVRNLFDTIKAWAILPGESYSIMVGVPIWQWLPGWISRNSNTFELRSFAFSLIIYWLSFVLKLINFKKIKENPGIFMSLAASLFGILYLILSAPDFRFGSIYFWIFFASVMSFFFVGVFGKFPKLQKIIIVLPLFLIYLIAWPAKFDGEIMLKSIRWDQSLTNEQITIKPSDGSSSFKVFVPGISNDSCGNSELPCTPEYKNDIKEIVPGDISKGFAPVK